MQIPELTTHRLLLRAFEPRDVDPYAAMMADAEVTRHLGDGRPLARTDAWRQLTMFAGHWTLRGFGVWAVEERATGRFIGRIGCFEPDGWPGFELTYTLARPSWGLGRTDRRDEFFGGRTLVYRYPEQEGSGDG